MQQFAVVIKEIRTFLTSFKLVKLLLPYHLHILFGGLAVLFLEELLARTEISYRTFSTLFYDIPLHLIAYYGFFVGVWLTLISNNIKLLSYGLWGYAFLALFPFEYLGLGNFVQAAIYAIGGYLLFRFAASSSNSAHTHNLNA